ncbi:MAG: hypothetical protein ACREFP_10000 [Acetobacteraceae bacterium]
MMQAAAPRVTMPRRAGLVEIELNGDVRVSVEQGVSAAVLGGRSPGCASEIPTKGNCKVQHCVSKRLYALGFRIECFLGQLEEERRIAPRCGKMASSTLGSCCSAPFRLGQVWARSLVPRIART